MPPPSKTPPLSAARLLRAVLFEYDEGPERRALLFCSIECYHNAMEYDYAEQLAAIKMPVPLARAVTCYGCGLTILECAEARSSGPSPSVPLWRRRARR